MEEQERQSVWPDFLEGEAHDAVCRLSSRAMGGPRHWCGMRRCRRNDDCIGALRPVMPPEGCDVVVPPLPPCMLVAPEQSLGDFFEYYRCFTQRFEEILSRMRRDSAHGGPRP